MHKVILYFFPLSCSSAHFIRLSSSYQAFTFTSFLHHTSVLLVCVFPQLLSHLSPSLYQTFTAFPITNTSFILDLPRLYQGFPPPSSKLFFVDIFHSWSSYMLFMLLLKVSLSFSLSFHLPLHYHHCRR